MDDSYAGLSRHYDLVMTSGYYDYDAYAATLSGLIAHSRRVLEIGVGTGLVCERLLSRGGDGLRLTGLDHTESMLVQARQRLGERVEFVHGDIRQLDLPSGFDVAFSVGGVWAYLRDGDETLFCSQLLEDRDTIAALRNVRAVLAPGGTFAVGVQGPHRDLRRELPGGLTYVQEVRSAGRDRLTKDYYVRRHDTVLAHQRCRFRLRAEDDADRLLARCGFRAEGATADGLFRHFTRV